MEKRSLTLESISVEEAITKDTIKKKNKQLLVFVSTRRIAENLTERLAKIVSEYLKEEEKRYLKKLSEDILNQLSTPTRQCRKLAEVVKKAVAFHHAGLLSKQKALIEDNFRKGLIKVVCCTPTLALGVNLPAFRVLIRDIKRYYSGLGSLEIPVLEYKQFAGRAGRPQYDRFGEAVIIAKSEEDKNRLIKKYILGKPEKIESKLSQEKSLRIHSLALIASEIASSLEGLLDFFALSFFGFQYKDLSFLKDKLTKILYDLESWNFIQRKANNLEATFLGKRITSLYIDPKSANFLIEALRLAKDLGISEFGILQALCYCDEMQPNLNVRAKDLEILQDTVNLYKDKILMDIPLLWDENYEEFLKSIKTALCFFAWINEAEESQLFEEFQITPGELHSKLEIIDWLVYSLIEIAKLLKFKEFCSLFKKLRWRLNYGVKEELLELVSLHGIGRVRARRLFEAGIKNLYHLKKAPFKTVKEILGEKIALKVLTEVR
ncbi:MAG: hypothetical protein NC903_03240 [Candidatus Omnitrophica bacterium]|nr:hypothetical protein [Candidatus Omnitrophota bacterium]